MEENRHENHDGVNDGGASIADDLNGHKRLEQRLETSEAYYKSLLNGSSDLITVADQTGTVSFASDSIQRILGYRPEEVLGKNILSFVDQEDLALAMERLSKAVDPSDLPVKIRVRRKDGTWCPCERTGRIVTGPDGNPLLISNVRDVTERDEIERENALLAAIVESSDDAITTIAPDLRVTYWNRGAERLLGYTAAETIGKPFLQQIPPKLHAQAMEILDQLMAHPEQAVRFEGPISRKDGTTVEVSTVCVTIRDTEKRSLPCPRSNAISPSANGRSGRLRCWLQ